MLLFRPYDGSDSYCQTDPFRLFDGTIPSVTWNCAALDNGLTDGNYERKSSAYGLSEEGFRVP